MECPFCAESVKTEAIVCKHCSRDLRVARPVMLEIQEIVAELHRLQRELDEVNARLARIRFPLRYFVTHSIAYVLIPILLLVTAHIVVTIVLDVTPLYLRLASVVIPLPFGLAKLQAMFLQFAPGALKLTPDQVALLRSDNVVSDAAKAAGLTLEGMGIAADSLEAIAPQYLWRFRKTGQFQHKGA